MSEAAALARPADRVSPSQGSAPTIPANEPSPTQRLEKGEQNVTPFWCILIKLMVLEYKCCARYLLLVKQIISPLSLLGNFMLLIYKAVVSNCIFCAGWIGRFFGSGVSHSCHTWLGLDGRKVLFFRRGAPVEEGALWERAHVGKVSP